MVTLPTYHICLICKAIEFLHQGGLPHQGADRAYVILLPEATYAPQNGLFALCIKPPTPNLRENWDYSELFGAIFLVRFWKETVFYDRTLII